MENLILGRDYRNTDEILYCLSIPSHCGVALRQDKQSDPQFLKKHKNIDIAHIHNVLYIIFTVCAVWIFILPERYTIKRTYYEHG